MSRPAPPLASLRRAACFAVLSLLSACQTSDPMTDQPGPPRTHASPSIHDRLEPVDLGSGFAQDGYWVWGASVVKGDDGRYHMFVSRWTKDVPFHPGWMTDSQIVHAVADSLEGPYAFSDVALGKRGAQYWDGQSCHNPKIVRADGKYLLYYMGSTHIFEPFAEADDQSTQSKHCIVGRSNKRIGLAIADSPYGPWQRRDEPIVDTRPETFYSFLVSNPSPVVHEDGSVLMAFKARAYEGRSPGTFTIGLIHADHYEGPYRVLEEVGPIFGPERFGVVEDPALWHDRGGYHMIAKDMSHDIAGEHHAGVLAHSPDGARWSLDPNPLAYSRTITATDGEQLTLGQMERPFPFIEDGRIRGIFFAVMDGPGGFANGTRSWNLFVPLRPE